MLKILHFSDAHIDMANHGKRDPRTGLPIRVNDFLKVLDQIIDYAIGHQVDLVLFTGDAYRDRSPAPTFQREWGKRMKRLSDAKIRTILLIGNHDTSPAFGRAHALQEFETLKIPFVHVISKPEFLQPQDLFDLPLQIIGIPWVSRSGLISSQETTTVDMEEIFSDIEEKLKQLIDNWLKTSDPDLPILFAAHASVQGADYGGERYVMLGKDLVLSGSLVKNPLFDYAALGHIHKPQNLNESFHPPVVYPGSIERVDFGEIEDQKYFVMAHIQKGKTHIEWIPLQGRKFLDHFIDLRNIYQRGFSESKTPQPEEIRTFIEEFLPEKLDIQDSITRLRILYPREWEILLEDDWIRNWYAEALEFQLVRKPVMEARLRLPENQEINSIAPQELLRIFWETQSYDPQEIKVLQEFAEEIIQHHDKMEDIE